jgi:hypothetical protein
MIKAATLGRAHPDPDARAELVTLLGHEERNVRLLAVRFLSRWDDAGGDLLVQYSVEPKPAVRQVILMTLAKVNTLNYDDALWERFDLEEKERLQKQIIRTIAGRGGAEIDRPALKRFEAASDVKVKRLLLQSLGEFGRAETVYALLPYALPGSQHEDVKGLVAKTIRQICTATNTAVPMALEPVNTEADGLGDRATLIPSSGG